MNNAHKNARMILEMVTDRRCGQAGWKLAEDYTLSFDNDGWFLDHDICSKAGYLERESAKVIFRGLLAPQLIEEFREWLEKERLKVLGLKLKNDVYSQNRFEGESSAYKHTIDKLDEMMK